MCSFEIEEMPDRRSQGTENGFSGNLRYDIAEVHNPGGIFRGVPCCWVPLVLPTLRESFAALRG